MTELLFKSGQVLAFVNDRVFEQILAKGSEIAPELTHRAEQLLAFVEASEAVLELAGLLAAGDAGKWALVVVIQTVK